MDNGSTIKGILKVYLQIRLKQIFRLSKGIGIFRSLFLLGISILLFYIFVKIEGKWMMPAVVIGVLAFYHNERDDKEFLSLQTKYAASLLRIEYLLIELPFVIIECLKTDFLKAGIMVAAAILLPILGTIKWKSFTIPLPFLYKGGIEYFRMFRLYGWLYFILLLISFIGASHYNIRIGKVALIVWGIIQTVAFTPIPKRQELTFYLNYSTFQKYLIQSSVWNTTVTTIPLIGIILCFSFTWENLLFSTCVMIGSMLYLWNLGMTRHLFSSNIAITIYQLMILIPLFFCTCFIPFLLIPFILINGTYYILVKNDSKKIWN